MHDGSSDEAAHLQEELRVGAAELAAVRAESRAVVVKVLGRLEGLRGELQELKTGKARSDERIAKLEESECGCGKCEGEEEEEKEAEKDEKMESSSTSYQRHGAPPQAGGRAGVRPGVVGGAHGGRHGRLLSGGHRHAQDFSIRAARPAARARRRTTASTRRSTWARRRTRAGGCRRGR
jgi:hypothetical protein